MRKIIFCILFLSLSTLVWADVPKTINYQARLTDLGGNPLLDGTYAITIRLYDSATATVPLWTEVEDAQTKNGYFSVALGSITVFPVGVDFNNPYWIGIKVGADSEMTPRQPLKSVPYALSVPVKSITTEKIADNAVTQTWYTIGADRAFNANSQSLTSATLTVTPAKDGTLFIWGKGALSSGVGDFYLVIRININGILVDGQEVIAPSVGGVGKSSFALQYAQPVSGGTTYTIEMYAYTSPSGTAYNGSTVANKLMAVVYYR
jgi:hypothetical protein